MSKAVKDALNQFSGVRKAEGEEPIFKAGDQIRISVRYPIGHARVPNYIRGTRGMVDAVIEPAAVNNEEEGFGRNAGNKRHYYRIAIPLNELWPGYTALAMTGCVSRSLKLGWKGTEAMNSHEHDHTPAPDSALGISYYEIMETVVRELLIEKRVIGPGKIRRQIEVLGLAHTSSWRKSCRTSLGGSRIPDSSAGQRSRGLRGARHHFLR